MTLHFQFTGCFNRNVFFSNLNYAKKIKTLYKMLYIFGKPIPGHLCFKYFKMIFSTNYALKTGFYKDLIFEELRI